MTATAHLAGVRKNADNDKFANDGSLASVGPMLKKLAYKSFARVQAMGLGMEYEDVHQEMMLSYVKAKEKWNPQGGALFSTYCTTVCLNNFNNAIKKMERDRRELGLVSASEFGSGDEEQGNLLENSMPANDIDLPEARLEKAQALRYNLDGLSHAAKKLVYRLLLSEQRSATDLREPPAKLRDLAKAAGVEGEELTRVKREILTKFGVKWR